MTPFQQWVARHGISGAAVAELVAMTYPPEHAVQSSSEAATQQAIRLHAARTGHVMWRNNNGACFDDTGRLIRYGLGNDSKRLNDVWKSGDLVGIQAHTGRLVMCEVKHPTWRAPESDRDRAQEAALMQVNALGGIGFFATHLNDYIRHVT